MKFLGVPYPIMNNAQGLLHSQGGVNQIKSDLLILLLTNPGERICNPNYGTPLKTLIFEPNDPTLATQAKKMIINSINAWEPRIAVQNITVQNTADSSFIGDTDSQTENGAVLSILITFVDPEQIKNVQSLNLQIPLSS